MTWGIAATMSAPGAVVAAAQTATEGVDITSIITGGITPALMVVLFLTGKIVTGKALEAEQQARIAAETRANEQAEKLLPMITLCTEVLNKVAPLLPTPPPGR